MTALRQLAKPAPAPRDPPAWLGEFIGIPWEPHGRTRGGCDCWGLGYLIAPRFGFEVPSYAPDYDDPMAAREIARLIEANMTEWHPVAERSFAGEDDKTGSIALGAEQPGDFVLMRRGGLNCHVGVVVARNLMVHIWRRTDSLQANLDASSVENAIVGIYRHESLFNPASKAISTALKQAPGTVEKLPPWERMVGPDEMRLIARTNPFTMDRIDRVMPPGGTITEILEAAGCLPPPGADGRVLVNGCEIYRDYWRVVRPKPGSLIQLGLIPQGGGGGGGNKSPITFVLSIALIAVSVALPVLLTPVLGAIGAGLITAGVGLVGKLLINALTPPPTQPSRQLPQFQRDASPPQLHTITGQRNRANPFGPIPLPLGTSRMYPMKAAIGYTETIGDDQYFRFLFTYGFGPVALSDHKIGETPIAEFDGVELEVREGYDTDAPITLYPSDVEQDDYSIELKAADPPTVRTSQALTTEISVDFAFPNGLFRVSSTGASTFLDVEILVEYRAAGSADPWVKAPWEDELVLFDEKGNIFPADGEIDVESKRRGLLRFGGRWKVTEGQYDVQVQRVTADRDGDLQANDTLFFAALRSFHAVAPIADHIPPLAQVAGRIKASGQLSGELDEFNSMASALVPDWDSGTGTWIEGATDNPASLFRHIFTGPHRRKPTPLSRMDLARLEEWHEACEADGWTFNGVIDSPKTVFELAQDIASGGRASFNPNRNGKFSVVRDKVHTAPVMMFSPHNSFGYEGVKTFNDLPHALRCRFINPDIADWDEVIVYRTGFTSANAAIFEVIEFPYDRDAEEVQKKGIYHFAQAIHRAEAHRFKTDVQNIVVERGDMVLFAHYVPLLGLGAGRIVDTLIDGSGDTASIIIDEEVEMLVGGDYVVRIQDLDGNLRLEDVTTVPGTTRRLDFDTPLALAPADQFQGDEHIAFGERGLETIEGIVHRIRGLRTGKAEVELLDHAPAVNADPGVIPPFTSNISPQLRAPKTPVISLMVSDEAAIETLASGAIDYGIIVYLVPPSGVAPRPVAYETTVTIDGEGISRPGPSAGGDATQIRIGGLAEGIAYRVGAKAIGRTTSSGWATSDAHTVVGRLDGLPAPDNFTLAQLAGGIRQFAWSYDAGPPTGAAGYRLRYGDAGATDFATMTPLHDGLVNGSPFDFTGLPAGSYSFAIAAVDAVNIESQAPAFLSAALSNPVFGNVIFERDERGLGWPGTKTDCFADGTVLSSVSIGGWDDLADTWDELPASWSALLPGETSFTYRTPELDLEAEYSFTSYLAIEGQGARSLTMRTGTAADGAAVGAFGEIAPVTGVRYVQYEVTVTGASPYLDRFKITLDGGLQVTTREDVATATAADSWFERLAAGHFRAAAVATTALSGAEITAIQNVGAGYTWELISKTETVGGEPAAEFKLYNGAGALADATVDIALRGSRT